MREVERRGRRSHPGLHQSPARQGAGTLREPGSAHRLNLSFNKFDKEDNHASEGHHDEGPGLLYAGH
jgi:hypothetical protein